MKRYLLLLFVLFLFYSCGNEGIFLDERDENTEIEDFDTSIKTRSSSAVPQDFFDLPKKYSKEAPDDIPWIFTMDDNIEYCEDNYSVYNETNGWAGIHVNATAPPIVIILRYVKWNENIVIPRLQVRQNRNIPKDSTIIGGMVFLPDKNTGYVDYSEGINNVNFIVSGKRKYYDGMGIGVESIFVSGGVPVTNNVDYGGPNPEDAIYIEDPIQPEDPIYEDPIYKSFTVNMNTLALSYMVIIPTGYVVDSQNSISTSMFYSASIQGNIVSYVFNRDMWEDFGEPSSDSSTIILKKDNYIKNYIINFTIVE